MKKVIVVGGSHFDYWIKALRDKGHNVHRITTVDQAAEYIEKSPPDIILIQVFTPGGKMFRSVSGDNKLSLGIDFVEQVGARYTKIKFLLLSGISQHVVKETSQVTLLPDALDISFNEIIGHVEKATVVA